MNNNTIKLSNLTRLQTRHLGNKILAADKNHIQGYEIITYKNYTPDTLKHVATIENTGDITWYMAYDMLFSDITAPDFTKVLN